MLFERFISRERAEPPDIDVDFAHQRREEVVQYIDPKYGRNRGDTGSTHAGSSEMNFSNPRLALNHHDLLLKWGWFEN